MTSLAWPRLRSASLALTLALTITLAGCAASPSPTPDHSGAPATPGTPPDSGHTDSYVAVMPDDFPENLFVPDGDLVSGVGSVNSWVIVKSIQLVDQARVAVDANVKSYGYTVDAFVDDDEFSSWNLSNDRYDVLFDLRPGSPITLTVTVDAR